MKKTNALTCFVQLVFAILPLLCLGIVHFNLSLDWTRGASGHLYQAGHANTVAVAMPELNAAVSYLEDKGLTIGNSAIFFPTPANDIGFFYKNIKASQSDLQRALENKNLSQLEESNLLIKLRESLLVHADHGDTVKEPDGMEIYPHNRLWCFLYIGSIVWGCCIVLMIVVNIQISQLRD